MSSTTLLPRPLWTAVLLTSIGMSGCGDSPTTPVGAAQNSPEAMFAQILSKLDKIESRIDSLEDAVGATNHTAVLAKLDSIEDGLSDLEVVVGGSTGGGVSLGGLHASQLDSLVALTSIMALDAVSGSWEACGGFALEGDFGFEWLGKAEFEGKGSLGAWAGTGAYAGGKLASEASLGGTLKLAGQGGVEFCYPLGGSAPPARPSTSGPLRSAALTPVQDALGNLTSQLNLTPATLASSITGIGTAISSPGSLNLRTVGATLPLPASISGMASDPFGEISTRIQGLTSNAGSQLCGATWGSNLATVITQACSIINTGGLPNITFFSDLSNTYPALQNAVSTVQTAVGTVQTAVSNVQTNLGGVQTAMTNVCSRVNAIGLQRLTIQPWDVTIINQTYNVFPGYNARLFPNFTSLTC